MITRIENGAFLVNGKLAQRAEMSPAVGKTRTMAYKILQAHNTSDSTEKLQIKFDAMASHDITYVGIIQTARASGLQSFPIPYVLTNCHNSLCAVGGTINEDDHLFGLSAAKKYGGIYVPAHQSVIHSYMRECMSGCGKMILGSDSHTRYGALGTMAIGEGGPELVKQLLCRTYDIDLPEVVCVYLTGTPKPGVGPQDVALALIGNVFADGFVKNRVLEFVGDGIANLPIEFRNGIDVMTTETTCLSSIWATDAETERYYQVHGRPDDFSPLAPEDGAYYERAVVIDLSKVESMIALPMHPSNVYTVKEVIEHPYDILPKYGLADKITEDGKVRVDQGVIAGCAGGTFDNLMAAAEVLRGKSIGCDAFALSAYPASQPVYMALMRNGAATDLLGAGVSLRTAFCGPCFGAGDVPANGCFSIRHSTRNFPNREGSKPANGQSAFVALMDARSIAATAANGGILTPATELALSTARPDYTYDDSAYKSRVYYGFGKANADEPLRFGPNIADWPQMDALQDHLLVKMASVILDDVTTTDELIPSGETSSYRSNPMKLAEFTLSRKDPAYVSKAKAALEPPVAPVMDAVKKLTGEDAPKLSLGSTIYAVKPGDGSAREQAASCQKVLGGLANIAGEYATKRYRSNLINWGMLPFLFDGKELPFAEGDYILVPNVREGVVSCSDTFAAYVIHADGCAEPFTLRMDALTADERQIVTDGCLINYYRNQA